MTGKIFNLKLRCNDLCCDCAAARVEWRCSRVRCWRPLPWQ